MTEVEMPSSKVLVEATLKALKSNGGRATNQQILDWTVANLNLTRPQIDSIRKGKRTELEYRLAWARTDAKRRELITRIGRSSWSLK